ncbi:formate dehydrogenase subunit gamma [Bacillota bacterium Lsc_1132]
MSEKQKPTKYVKRFSKAFIWAHAINAFSFFALYVTALPLYTDFFNWLYPVLGGPANARLLHRIFAVMFVTPTIIYLLFDRKGFFFWMKQLITWKKRDLGFFSEFIKEFFGAKAKTPKQGFFNAGEKINSLLQMVTAIIIIASGITMWFPQFFSRELVQWGYLMHNVGFGLAIAVVVGHIYLSILHPGSSPAFRGVVKGDVDVNFVKSHYREWYDELVKEGKIIPDDQNKSKGA